MKFWSEWLNLLLYIYQFISAVFTLTFPQTRNESYHDVLQIISVQCKDYLLNTFGRQTAAAVFSNLLSGGFCSGQHQFKLLKVVLKDFQFNSLMIWFCYYFR